MYTVAHGVTLLFCFVSAANWTIHCFQLLISPKCEWMFDIANEVQSNFSKWIPLKWITRLNGYNLSGPV